MLSGFLLIKNGLELLVCTWEFGFQEVFAKLSLRKNFTSYHFISMELCHFTFRYVGVEC